LEKAIDAFKESFLNASMIAGNRPMDFIFDLHRRLSVLEFSARMDALYAQARQESKESGDPAFGSGDALIRLVQKESAECEARAKEQHLKMQQAQIAIAKTMPKELLNKMQRSGLELVKH
jgi:hypothetical protein